MHVHVPSVHGRMAQARNHSLREELSLILNENISGRGVEGSSSILPATSSLGKPIKGIEENLTNVLLRLCVKRGDHTAHPPTYASFGSSGLVSGAGPCTQRAPGLAAVFIGGFSFWNNMPTFLFFTVPCKFRTRSHSPETLLTHQ